MPVASRTRGGAHALRRCTAHADTRRTMSLAGARGPSASTRSSKTA